MPKRVMNYDQRGLLMLLAISVVAWSGCNDSEPPPLPALPQVSVTPPPSAPANTTAATAAPAATSTAQPAAPAKQVKFQPADLELYVVKDGKAFVQLNLFPEADALRALDAAERETYLYRRAAKSLLEKGLAHPQFKGKDEFVVRLVMLKSMDEYGRPKWNDAAEIGRLTATRASLESQAGQTATSLSSGDAAALFSQRKLSIDSLGTLLR